MDIGAFLRLVSPKKVKPYANVFSLIALSLLFSVAIVFSAIYRNIVFYYFLAVTFSALLLLLDHFRLPDGQNLWKFGAFFSSFSFTLYAVHYPLQMFVIDLLRDRFNIVFPVNEANLLNWLYFGTLNISIYIFCYIVYLITEKHTSLVRKSIDIVYKKLRFRLQDS